MIATPAGQMAKLAGKLKTTGFASPKTRESEERRACRSSVAAKRARQDNMSEAEKGVGQQSAEARASFKAGTSRREFAAAIGRKMSERIRENTVLAIMQ
jgi:preprotein translocase subunit SecF